MQSIVDWVFTVLDMTALVLCSMYAVILLPRDTRLASHKKSICILRIAAWLIYAALAVLIPMLWRNDLVTMFGLSVYYGLMGFLLYHRDKIGIMYQMGFMFFLYVVQMVALFTATKIWEVFSLEYRAYSYIWILLRVILLIVITIIFRMLVHRRYVVVQPYFKMKIRGMLCVPVISMILIFWFTISSDVFLMRFGYEWLILYCVLVLVMNLYCLYFWYDVSKTQELKHKLEMMQQQNELTHQFYADLESNYAKSRKVIHDIRNHLQMLEQSRKLAESQSYVADVYQMLNALGMTYYTDNRMLNIILNDKLKLLGQEQFHCNLMGVHLDFLSEMDTTTIFANLLDNAMEEWEENDDFRLEIQGEQIQDFCVIKLSNTMSGTYIPGKSSKAGHEGIGLENVRNAVGKYHGEMQTDQKEQMFSVTLLFPDDS